MPEEFLLVRIDVTGTEVASSRDVDDGAATWGNELCLTDWHAPIIVLMFLPGSRSRSISLVSQCNFYPPHFLGSVREARE